MEIIYQGYITIKQINNHVGRKTQRFYICYIFQLQICGLNYVHMSNDENLYYYFPIFPTKSR